MDGPQVLVERLQRATNDHDVDAVAACFAEDYENETPVHPARGFRGRDQVRRNWTQIFAIRARPPRRRRALSPFDGDTAWTEWEMTGTRRDGTAHLMRGVIVFGVRRRRRAVGPLLPRTGRRRRRHRRRRGATNRSSADDPRRGWHRSARHARRERGSPTAASTCACSPAIRARAASPRRRGDRDRRGRRTRSRRALERAVEGVTVVVSAVQGFAGPGRVTPASVDRDGNANLVDAAAGGRRRRRADVGRSARPTTTDGARSAPSTTRRSTSARAAVGWTIVRSTAFVELWAEIMTEADRVRARRQPDQLRLGRRRRRGRRARGCRPEPSRSGPRGRRAAEPDVQRAGRSPGGSSRTSRRRSVTCRGACSARWRLVSRPSERGARDGHDRHDLRCRSRARRFADLPITDVRTALHAVSGAPRPGVKPTK